MGSNSIKKDEEVMRRSKREITAKLLTYLKPYKFKAFITKSTINKVKKNECQCDHLVGGEKSPQVFPVLKDD